MDFKIIFENENLLAMDKPPGINSDDFEKRVHRLDKDTSGILLVAKNDEALIKLQKQFKDRTVEKKYIALVVGSLKNESGTIETLIGRSPKDRKKQKVYFPQEPGADGKRTAITEYKILERYKDYTLLEVTPKTGRKHQIRTHLAYLSHPIAGDQMYGFKNQPCPKGLKRHFLHANYLKIRFKNQAIEIKSKLPADLEKTITNIEKYGH